MKTLKTLVLISLAGAALYAGQAFATPCPTAPATGVQTQPGPVCLAPYGQDGQGTGLQNILSPYNSVTNPNGVIMSGPGVNVYNSQVIPSSFWAIGGTGTSANQIVLELAGNAASNTFGIFDPNNPNNYLQLFSGPASAGYSTTLLNLGNGQYRANYFGAGGTYLGTATAQFSVTNMFGYYLFGPSGNFFSDAALNEAGGSTYPNGTPHMVAFIGNGTNTIKVGGVTGTWLPNEYIMAWEDTPFARSDLDYNDFVVIVESVHPVPEPAVLGMFGLGLIGMLFAIKFRRRRNQV